jgi:TetR/AcrR family fatty acid metabolism transcriptional regulator
MQKPDDAKRSSILQAAARLFASRQFHEVKLDDVALEAKVGKGTLYIYFRSKEALFSAIVDEAFARVVADIRASLEGRSLSRWEGVGVVVRELVRFGLAFPDKFRLMRAGVDVSGPCSLEARQQLIELIVSVLREGVERGEFTDTHPELSAGYVLSCVRGALLYGPPGLSEETLVNHILHVLGHGLSSGHQCKGSP